MAWLTLNRPERLNAGLDSGGQEQGVALEDRNQVFCTRSGDFRQGVSALLEKRPPVRGDA